MNDSDGLLRDIEAHYQTGIEESRLARKSGALEFARTQEIVERYLKPDRRVILDVGGGTGPYARWLAGLGHEVHLIDAVPLHVECAQAAPGPELATIATGDARELPFDAACADLVLLLGPLYHLTTFDDRVMALSEARRVLRADGVVIAACISRFASALDGLAAKHLDEPAFVSIVDRDLETGQHRNPENHPAWFTTAYFHHPNEIRTEFERAGLRYEATLAVEGPTWIMRDFESHWDDAARRRRLLDTLRKIESEPSMMGASSHFLAVGRKA